jgi:hypothetical protein
VIGVSMLVLFPLTFLSNVFVDPRTMPGWLQGFVQVNPISHLVAAVRSLTAGKPDVAEIGWVLIASVLLTVVFGTLTMRLYNRKWQTRLPVTNGNPPDGRSPDGPQRLAEFDGGRLGGVSAVQFSIQFPGDHQQ